MPYFGTINILPLFFILFGILPMISQRFFLNKDTKSFAMSLRPSVGICHLTIQILLPEEFNEV
jgi:hypothetical protein